MVDCNLASGLDRRQYLTGLGTALAAGFAGCSGSDGDGGNGGGGFGTQDFDFWLFGGIPAEREYISGNSDSYGEHDVSYQHQEWGQKYQIIASAAANNNLPDAMAGQCQQIPDDVGTQAIQALDQESFRDQLEEGNSHFIQANIDTGVYEGLGDTDGERQWGLPGGYADLGPFIDIPIEAIVHGTSALGDVTAKVRRFHDLEPEDRMELTTAPEHVNLFDQTTESLLKWRLVTERAEGETSADGVASKHSESLQEHYYHS